MHNYATLLPLGLITSFIFAKLKLNLQASNKADQRLIRYDWKELSDSTEIQEGFTTVVRGTQ